MRRPLTACSIGSRSGWPSCRCPYPQVSRTRRPPMHSRIAGSGGYLPARVVANAELAARMDTSDEWVRTRTGICERRVAADHEQTSDLALAASLHALEA